ncbi:uncharacterized protein LOC111361930 [Spodoptera litura]|uniref:Uncharacterized protein LOC111361930 n=1 Tax=Spodoptera litura TaxID=69820 RepID=A0A9J7J214_SPOLT|nr:uncharacterized protein LOC111361930 [Spodoptera litura]
MKIFIVLVVLAAAAAAGVTNNDREQAAALENKELHLPDIVDNNELDVPEKNEPNVPDRPDNTELDVPEDEIGEEDEETGLAAARNNLSLGTFGADDRLMSRITHNVAAATLLIHDQEITFRGTRGTNITAIRVNQVGTNTPIATRVAGGLGSEFVTIRIQSGRGRAFSYTILVYAAINCSNN